MAIIVGTNSWETILEADTYLTNRVGASDWFNLSDAPASPGNDSKESFLVTAYYWLLDDPGFGLSPSDSADDLLKRAQSEAALFLQKYRKDYENRESKISSGVERFKNSKWEEDLGTVSKPQVILNLIGKLGNSNQNGFALLDVGD